MKGSASHLLEFPEGSRKRFVIPVYQIDEDELVFGVAPAKETDE